MIFVVLLRVTGANLLLEYHVVNNIKFLIVLVLYRKGSYRMHTPQKRTGARLM